MLELIWASFVNVIAPVLGTLAGVVGLLLLTKLLKSLGLSVEQKQLDALATAARQAVTATEAWAEKKAADSGAKVASKEKAAKAVGIVKTFLTNQQLYNIAEDKIVAAIEAKLGEDAQHLDLIVETIRNRKSEKTEAGN
jgi:hypothetical protein